MHAPATFRSFLEIACRFQFGSESSRLQFGARGAPFDVALGSIIFGSGQFDEGLFWTIALPQRQSLPARTHAYCEVVWQVWHHDTVQDQGTWHRSVSSSLWKADCDSRLGECFFLWVLGGASSRRLEAVRAMRY